MDNLCRICYKSGGTIYIFKQGEHSLCLGYKIMYCCAKVSIAQDDGLPSQICSPCEKELDQCYRFVQKCENTDRTLRSSAVLDLNSSKDLKDCAPKIEVKEENINHENEFPEEFSVDSVEIDKHIKFEDDLKTSLKKPKKKKIKYKSSECCACAECGRNFTRFSALMVHLRTHSKDKPYACSMCDKKYKDAGGLKRHNERNHLKDKRIRNFICEQCGKGFFSSTEVNIHMRTHTGETPYVCSMCPRKFTQLSAMLRHKRRHTGEKNHKCSTCSKAFCTKEELKSHLRVHTKEKKFMCPDCKAPFKYENNLQKHIKQHSVTNSFICDYCGRTFNVKGNLQVHIDRIHSEKSGFCAQCSKSVSNIEVHMWRHTGQRPLKCDLCSSSFYELKALAHHVNFRHKNVNKFKCNYEGCTMKFPTQSMLNFHVLKLHGTGIPFPCDKCPRGFYRKSDLARHKIGTHKERLTD